MDLKVFSSLDEKYDTLCTKLDALTDALHTFPRSDQQTHSKQEREWQRFAMIDGGKTDGSGNLTVGGGGTNLIPAPNGWEAFITSIAVTVTGASAAATVTNYNGEVSDANLLDFASAMLGNSPSRIIAFYDFEVVYCEQADPLSIVVAGAVASANVTVRVCGKRRQT
jgi:hypothetical protein